jgi:hypothetical protein
MSAKRTNEHHQSNCEKINFNDYDRKADLSAAAKKSIAGCEESSDQKMVIGLSGKETDTDHFNSLINIPNNQNEIMEFEFFMNNI